MKKVLLVLVLCAFTFVSCNDDDGNIVGVSFFDETISGKLMLMESNWEEDNYFPTYKDVTTEVDEIYGVGFCWERGGAANLGRASVSNGQFALKLLVPNEECLENIFEEFEDMEGVTISDKNVKGTFVELICAKDGELVGRMFLSPANLNDDINVMFIYADRNVTIKGTEKDTYDDEIFITEYNMNLQKGWNAVVGKEYGNEYTMATQNIPASMFCVIYSKNYNDDSDKGMEYTQKTRRFKSFRK